uniref:Uncharacterized protein n=1 Tax=Anguilla anguilla TaxID=7936 RepID=A0A0E9SE14_ANGAN
MGLVKNILKLQKVRFSGAAMLYTL